MSLQAQIILVGCGNMGFAMLTGWLDRQAVEPGAVWVVEPTEELRTRADQLGVHTVADEGELPAELTARILLFAVKPQLMDKVLPAYAGLVERCNPAISSVAAGIGISRFEAAYGSNRAVIRVMPNTPSAIGQGMMVICANAQVSQAQLDFVHLLMEASGRAAIIDDEALMDAVTAVSGSGPSYLFHMIEALREAAVRAGLPNALAHELAMQTIVGAANYAEAASDDVAKLREQVTSPNGTTAAALDVLMREHDGMTSLLTEAVEAARKRSEELGG
ncbi:MAG: pyrroline-5-carboxylate reductase [Pseudomonadota bacterium]